MKQLEKFPLDILILYSLKEFNDGNLSLANKIHRFFELKVKESLLIAEKALNIGNNFKVDNILSNIAKAKIVQTEWLSITSERKKSLDNRLEIPDKNKFDSDILKSLKNKRINFVESFLEKILTTFNKSQFKKTEHIAKQLIIIFPKVAEFHNLLGSSQIALGKYIHAIKTYENALKFNPKDAELFSNLGLSNLKSGFLIQAELYFRKSIHIDEKILQSNKNLGDLLLDQGNYFEAEYYQRKVISIDSFNASGFANLSICLSRQNKLKEALNIAKKSCELSPQNILYLNNLGLIYKANKLLENAEFIFRLCIKIKPEYSEAHNNLGTLLQKYNIADAIHHYHIAEKLEKNSSDILFNLAVSYRQISKHKTAIKYAQKSILFNPKNSNSLKILGVLQSDSGDFKSSIKSLKSSIENNPNETETYRLLGRIYRYNKNEILNLEKIVVNSKINFEQKKHLWFSLGKAYEDIRDFPKSWKNYNLANNFVNQKLNYSLEKEVLYFNSIKKVFVNLKPNQKIFFPPTIQRPIFIIGMPRSGTTLVEQIISSNKKVFPGGELEIIPKFMGASLITQLYKSNNNPNNLFIELIKNLRSQYFEKIRLKTNKKIFTDKMPHNFLYLGILKLAFPEAKFIYVSRDPLDNCFSIYKNYFSDNGHPFSYNLEALGKYYLLQEDLFKFWKNHLPDSIDEIKYENIITNKEDAIRNLIASCDLNWSKKYLEFHKNSRVVYTSSSYQVRKKIYSSSIGSWKNYSIYLEDLKKILIK